MLHLLAVLRPPPPTPPPQGSAVAPVHRRLGGSLACLHSAERPVFQRPYTGNSNAIQIIPPSSLVVKISAGDRTDTTSLSGYTVPVLPAYSGKSYACKCSFVDLALRPWLHLDSQSSNGVHWHWRAASGSRQEHMRRHACDHTKRSERPGRGRWAVCLHLTQQTHGLHGFMKKLLCHQKLRRERGKTDVSLLIICG